ncbi:hypothetical protein PROFUN_15823 [Planoprotostelium fungivorum]|uniref:F-box domain-containing protein n=1 Tax=Planoprotostelium fungivorum TaxID=1890364 RepID=A0A2P6MU85_9EUKA|nr:hypothetical protein PROFUN_15823 [Planoprotostelium fungivorum]
MSTNSVQQIPPDVWTGILSFLPTPDLCISCFTSKTLRDSACHLLDSRASISSLWWRHQKLLPVHNVEIVKWWQSTIREATKQEVIEAVRGDHEEVLDLLGWDDRHLSPHHRLLTRSCQDIPEWNWMDILFEAIVKGSKRVITACHRKKKMDHSKLSTSQHCRSLSEPLGIEGNLEMIQWICGMGQVDGLSADILDPKFWYPFDLRPSGHKLAQHGHRHVTLDVFRWALKHNAPHSPDKNRRRLSLTLNSDQSGRRLRVVSLGGRSGCIPKKYTGLRRKWKKSREEVQRWFNKESEDITNDWLDHLWEFGTEEEVQQQNARHDNTQSEFLFVVSSRRITGGEDVRRPIGSYATPPAIFWTLALETSATGGIAGRFFPWKIDKWSNGGFDDDCHSWDWQDILAESIAYGCKRLINACHERGHFPREFQVWWGDPWLYGLSFIRVCQEGNLEMIQWMLNNKEVEGLPSSNLSASFNFINMELELGKRGNREVIHWLLESDLVHKRRMKYLYGGAAEGGRMDVIAWLEEKGIPFKSSCSDIHYFVTSLSILKWAKKHNIVVERAYEFALRIGQPEVMKYCFENGMGLPEHPFIELSIKHENTKALQLAIDHQFLTKETNITFDIESGNLKMIKYLHDRDLLQLEVSKYINDLDYYDVLQWAIDKDYPAGKLDDRNFFLKVSPEVIEWMIEKYGEDEKVFDQLVLDVKLLVTIVLETSAEVVCKVPAFVATNLLSLTMAAPSCALTGQSKVLPDCMSDPLEKRMSLPLELKTELRTMTDPAELYTDPPCVDALLFTFIKSAKSYWPIDTGSSSLYSRFSTHYKLRTTQFVDKGQG